MSLGVAVVEFRISENRTDPFAEPLLFEFKITLLVSFTGPV